MAATASAAARKCSAFLQQASAAAHGQGRQRRSIEGRLERAHRVRPQPVVLADALALLGEVQHATDRLGRRGAQQRIDAAAAARNAAAAAVEDDVALVGAVERRGQVALRPRTRPAARPPCRSPGCCRKSRSAPSAAGRANHNNPPQQAFKKFPHQIACVIVEPVVGNMGCVPPTPLYLDALREITIRDGALLIFDEVMTGFRLAFGGAQERYGILPDLTTFGKIIGGGLPVGAYGGPREIMDMVAPLGPVYQAGTLSGNPLAMAAGLATLRYLRSHRGTVYTNLEILSGQLVEGVTEAAKEAGVPICYNRVGSMFTWFFTEGPVTDWASASKCDTAAFARFFRAMLDSGIYLPASQFEAAFLSAAHTRKDIEQTIAAASQAFATVAVT